MSESRAILTDKRCECGQALNLHRRHLSESQRAMVAAKLATLSDGQRGDLVEGLPIGRASSLLNVGERTVARAREVIQETPAEVAQAVERGDVAVSLAAQVADLPELAKMEVASEIAEQPTEAAKIIRAHVANNSGENEWYTPEEYIAAAREVVGLDGPRGDGRGR